MCQLSRLLLSTVLEPLPLEIIGVFILLCRHARLLSYVVEQHILEAARGVLTRRPLVLTVLVQKLFTLYVQRPDYWALLSFLPKHA